MQVKMFDLTRLEGGNGFVIPGFNVAVSGAGDVNGDGIADLVLGSYGANSFNGASYVLFGSRGGFPPSFSLANLNGSNGFVIPGIAAGGELGTSVSTAGDVNGDGIADLILGAPYANSVGGSYVLFGTRGGFPPSFNLTNLNGSNGFLIPGLALDGYLGISVSTAGDVNGDGIVDLVLGAPAYIIFGSHNGFPASFNLSVLNGTNGFTVPDVSVVSTAGDVNGDGLDDLVLGAPGAGNGASYVLFGTRGGFPPSFNLSNLDGSNGFVIPGVAAGGNLGTSVSAAGDVNGDGITDLVLGAHAANSYNGTSYVLFGTRAGFPQSFNLSNLNGGNGFVIPGVAADGNLGWSVSTAGDVNGDGITDLILGAPVENSFTGAIYVLFGTRGGFPPSFNLANLNGSDGFVIPGVAAGGALGNSVSAVGDVNGDGVADLVFGAPAYVIFGGYASITLVKNELVITQGQTIVLTGENLSVFGSVSPFSLLFNSLSFTANQVQGGRFVFANNPNITIANFTQQQINNGQIAFISDRTAPVAYQIAVYNITNGQIVLSPTPADVVFIHHPPQIINYPSSQMFIYNRPFNFTFLANQTFGDPDGAPLTYSVGYENGSPLPNWIQFTNDNNQFIFSGNIPPFLPLGTSEFSLIATDPLNTTAVANFNVTFVNYPPQVINPPTTQVFTVGEASRSVLIPSEIFYDPDGDSLSYSAGLSDGFPLPSWLNFDANPMNELILSGIAPSAGGTEVRLTAKDPLNANVSTEFQIIAVPNNNSTSTSTITNQTSQIVAPIAVGLGVAAIASAAFGLWRYFTNKKGREGYQLANYLRIALNLRGIDNFYENENGRKYVAIVQELSDALKHQGIDVDTMDDQAIRQLAADIADAARNKISTATYCLGESVITVSDLKNRMQDLVTEVQALRAGGKQNMIQ